MNHIEKLQQLFSQAQTDYPRLKEEIEAQVVSWFWTTDCYYSLEPFWFEELRYPKGKILQEKPNKSGGHYQYGVDKNGEIIIERQYVELEYYPEAHFYERFFFRKGDEILSYRFDYSDKNIENIKQFVYENGRLTAIYSVFEKGGFWIENLVYEGEKMVRKEEHGRDVYGKNFERVKNYTYDNIGQLQTIAEGDYVWYQAPDKKISYKKLAEMVSEKLYPLLVDCIKTQAPKELLYCITISYDNFNTIPPAVGFGTDPERQHWISTHKRYQHLLWNTADYQYYGELEFDQETENLFDLFNQETEMKGKYSTAVKVIVECVKKLKTNLLEFDFARTDNFVFIATDLDQSDMTKNFKAINPEKVKAFKEWLV